jgi:hypothetical protein
MATDEQRARRRAQRELAKARQQKRTGIEGMSKAYRKKRLSYADSIIAGETPAPDPSKRNAETNNLASLAGKARHGKADPKYIAAFKQYWYHKNDSKDANEADIEDNADHESDSDSESGEEE